MERTEPPWQWSAGPAGPGGPAGPTGRDAATAAFYATRADEYGAARRADAVTATRAGAFAAKVDSLGPDVVRVDLGAGAGRFAALLGTPLVAVDASAAMLTLLGDRHPAALAVQADLAHLPFVAGSVGGIWAHMTYHHVPAAALPMALAQAQQACRVGAALEVSVVQGTHEGADLPGDEFADAGRFFAAQTPQRLADVVCGAGFGVDEVVPGSEVAPFAPVRVAATRLRSLPDTVGPGMRLLVVGLNPSEYAADAGVGFARPGNRFWPAALAAGMVSVDRDPVDALASHGIGMTDAVKRATPRADMLARAEYVEGFARLERLVTWLAPRAVVFVGLSGWRAVRDRGAHAGIQPQSFGGRPVYVMPSTSGLNAHASLADLTAHLRAALALADSTC